MTPRRVSLIPRGQCTGPRRDWGETRGQRRCHSLQRDLTYCLKVWDQEDPQKKGTTREEGQGTGADQVQDMDQGTIWVSILIVDNVVMLAHVNGKLNFNFQLELLAEI